MVKPSAMESEMTEIGELLERVKAATGPDRKLDRAIGLSVGGLKSVEEFGMAGNWWERFTEGGLTVGLPPYTASIDAALALVERVLPGWVVSDLSQNSRHAGDPWGCELALYFGSEPSKNRSAFSGWDFPTAPLAILTALLSALTALQDQNNEG